MPMETNQQVSVDEAKKLKRELEKQIAKLLFDFSSQSGLTVQDINLKLASNVLHDSYVEVKFAKPTVYFVEIQARL